MSTKHTATLPDGTIAKRTSANRVYPFVIAVGPLTEEQIRADLEASAVLSDEYAAKYMATAEYLEGGGELVVKRDTQFGVSIDYVLAPGLPFNGASDERNAHRGLGVTVPGGSTGYGYTDVESARVAVADSMRRYAAQSTERSAELRTRKTDTVGWRAVAWSSRPELAAKVAESTRSIDPRREVRVLDTVRS